MRVVVSLLAASLVAQLFYVGGDHHRSLRYAFIDIDQRLPFEVDRWDEHVVPAEDHIAFICSPTCAACAALAERFATADPDTLAEEALPRWFVTADVDETLRWATERGVDPGRVHSLGVRVRFGGLLQQYGSVYFTPTRLVLTDDLIVRDARPSDELPSPRERIAIREGAGIAPRSLAEFSSIMSGSPEFR